MATASDLLRVARAEVGNTSGRKYWDAYWRGSWSYVDGDTTPYCACFVSWCLAQAGVTAPHFPSAVAFDQRDDLGGRSVSRWDLQPGDLVAFDWDGDGSGDHVGIVEAAHGGGTYTCIEGNTSGGVVARRTRYASQIVCGIAPRYSEEDEMTEADFQRIQKMIDENNKKVGWWVWSYKYKPVNGDKDAYALLTEVPVRVWGYRNKEYESMDAYRILRDVRNALFPNAAKKLDGYEAKDGVLAKFDGVLAKVCAALGIKQ